MEGQRGDGRGDGQVKFVGHVVWTPSTAPATAALPADMLAPRAPAIRPSDDHVGSSPGDIFLNLHKIVGKTLVARALEALGADGRVNERLYGKQKIYFPLQVRPRSLVAAAAPQLL